jgi:pimeloyl-ACP methyl ester carboxylesterase
MDMAKSVLGVAPGTVRAALEDTSKQGYNLEGAMRMIQCPTLLIYGDFTAGSVVREKDAARFKQLVPQAMIRKIPGGNHMLWWEQAGIRQRFVQEFIHDLA